MTNTGTSSIAIPASTPWDAADRPKDWQGRVYGLVVHTTGGSLPASAKERGVYHTVRAVEHYSQSHGCHYVNGWQGAAGGDLIQMANEREQAIGVGMTDQKRSVDAGRFEADLPAVLVRLWGERWPGKNNPMELLPGTKTANSCYIHVECVPCVYHYKKKLITDEAAEPMRPGLRFTQAQLDTVALLAVDIANRNGWPADQPWWRTPRLLGHEDLTPIARFDPHGGWDPGWLREKPYFDWDYVYGEIERLVQGGAPVVPAPSPGRTVFGVLGDALDRFLELLGTGQEILAVGVAHAAGVKDANLLTNLVFFGRHPEMGGRKIRPDEPELAKEWITVRDIIVKPALESLEQ